MTREEFEEVFEAEGDAVDGLGIECRGVEPDAVAKAFVDQGAEVGR